MSGFIRWLHSSLSVWHFFDIILCSGVMGFSRVCKKGRRVKQQHFLHHHSWQQLSAHILWNHGASHDLGKSPISPACLPQLQLSPALGHAPCFPQSGVLVLHWCIPRIHRLMGCTGAHLKAWYNPKSFSWSIVSMLLPLCWKGRITV